MKVGNGYLYDLDILVKDFSPHHQASKKMSGIFLIFLPLLLKKKFYEDYCKMNRVLKNDEEKLNFKVMTRNLQICS